jgi:predicted nucleotidyltransferase
VLSSAVVMSFPLPNHATKKEKNMIDERNVRARSNMKGVEDVKDLTKEIKDHLIDRYGDDIRQVVVYGSYARGEATDDSDLDVLVVVSDSLDPVEVERSLSDLLFDLLLERKELVSVIAIPEDIFENYRSPFILNAREEGVPI